ncbi:uncharacterized protein LOC107486011 [Arachis duranensis]|uniref:Uncharacterized protein LOC107486011 n=1 Tax=Arachis duranensis TaxID=130453 RepID=A0A6P4D7C3_ARADU|nr:uncharacterized protein LOC107486011 [Arachis duranensis]
MSRKLIFIGFFGHSYCVSRPSSIVSHWLVSTTPTCTANTGGTLLVAIAQDSNSNIILVAFALVEDENTNSWSFFLSHLRQHVTPQSSILVISDRHNGIKVALEASNESWLPPNAYQAFCIQHVAVNFALSFEGKDAQRFLVNVAYAKTEVEFDYWFDILRSKDPTMGVRNLPVCSLVKSTYRRLVELFVRKGREAKAQLGTRHQFSQHLMMAIQTNLKASRCFTMTLYNRDNSEFTVAETTPLGSFSLGSYRVSLRDQTCDCRYFQALHYPCRLCLSVLFIITSGLGTYVHEVYHLNSVFNVYRIGFTPPIPERFWPPYNGSIVIPDPAKRRAFEGRSKTTRIQNTMDKPDPNRPKIYGLCR